MDDRLLAAFLGQHFDPVFALTAATSNAHDALHYDVPALHAEARTAIAEAASAALQAGADPTLRTVLIQAPAGYGKTHRLITSLLQLSQAGQAYPAVMQLSAKVNPETLSLWMLQKVIDELMAGHFRDASGFTPLQRLTHTLWAKAPKKFRSHYERALEQEQLDAAADAVKHAAKHIRQAYGSPLDRRDERLLSALLLQADAVCPEVDAWFRGGKPDPQACLVPLPVMASEVDYQRILGDIARIAHVTGAPLVLAIDQIEAIARIGDERLLTAVITTALQLVENCPRGLMVLISALEYTYEHVIKDKINDSFRQRIELGIAPVRLQAIDLSTMRTVINRRVECLLEREGWQPPPADAGVQMLPDWLLARSERGDLRHTLQTIREYRQACRNAQRFLSEDDYAPAPSAALDPDTSDTASPEPRAASEVEDFDKLWQDCCDADLGASAHYSDHDRQQMVVRLAERVAEELPHVDSVSATAFTLTDNAVTRMVDLHFKLEPDTTVERWKIAFADAPNQKNRLREQIYTVLNHTTEAKPALLRNSTLPGVDDYGKPNRSPAALRKLQLGPALADFLAAGGRVACTNAQHWQRLQLALKFYDERQAAEGFLDWCRQRRFLLEHAGIGPLSHLLQPEGQGINVGSTPPVATPAATPQHNVPSEDLARPDPDSRTDPRDHAKILLGHDAEQQPVHWLLDKTADPALPNFGLLVSGDTGQGKTQAIKAVIAAAAQLNCPILLFDFKNDYADTPNEPFASDNRLTVIDLNNGLPFNPLRPPPQGSSGAQVIDHIFEVAGILETALRLGDQQKALLREALETAFARLGVPLREWIDPETSAAPSMADVIAIAEDSGDTKSQALINRLGLLHGKRLLPADAVSQISFETLMQGRFVLSFHNLPNDDQLKRALAELILTQIQGYMLRGEQPRALRRLLVFDEAWRAADSRRLIQLAREGRAFGVGVIAGSQFAGDLAPELTGNLASKLHLYNSDAVQRRKIVQTTLGTVAGNEANRMQNKLSKLKKFEGIFTNQQYTPYRAITLLPYYAR